MPDEAGLRQFLIHLLPKGFVRMRNFEYLANRRQAVLWPLCFQCLASVPETPTAQAQPEPFRCEPNKPDRSRFRRKILSINHRGDEGALGRRMQRVFGQPDL